MTEEIAVPTVASLIPTKADLETGGAIDTGAKADGRFSCPYVGWYGGKTRETDALDAAGVECGTFYLYDGEPLPVMPFEFHLIAPGRFYTKADDNGQAIEARLDCPDEAFEDGFREHLFFVALVRRPTSKGLAFTPAVGTLRAAQCRALQKPLDMLNRARDASAWAERGKPHAESAHAKIPGGRFVTTIWSKEEKTQTGRMQNVGYGLTRPTPKAEVDALNAFYEANLPAIQAVAAVNNARIAAVKKLL